MTISSHSPPYSRCQHDLVRLAIDHNQVPEVAHQLAMTISTLRRAQPQPSDVLDEALQWFLVKTWNFGVEQHAQRRRTEAVQLCSLAMQLLPMLTATSRLALSDRLTSTFALLTASRRTLA